MTWCHWSVAITEAWQIQYRLIIHCHRTEREWFPGAISRKWNSVTTAASSCVTTSECFTGSVHFLVLSKTVFPRQAVTYTSDNYEEATKGSRVVSNCTLYDYGWQLSNTHKIKLWNMLPFFVYLALQVFSDISHC